MDKKLNKKSIFPILCAALFLLIGVFSGCSQSAPELSPMPAVDMSKNSILTVTSDEPEAESTFKNISPIELSDPVEMLISSNSNTENNGLAAVSENTIYFVSDGLGSMSVSGYHRKTLEDRPDIYYLNTYENFVYYVCSNDYCVYRADINSLDSPEKLDISGAYSMKIIGDHIYYQKSIGPDADNYIYRTDMDGTNAENLMIKASAYVSDGQNIFFANQEDGDNLYTLDTCTGIIEQLSNNQASQLNIIDGSLYYINKKTRHITRLVTETGESTVLSEDNFQYLNSAEDFLVFYSEDTDSLGTMNLDGSDVKQILKYNDVNALNVAGGWVFFESYDNTFEEEVFFIKTDGTELSKDLPIVSTAKITGYDPEKKMLYCDFVKRLTGEDAIKEYINDNSVSERKAEETLAETGGVYIQNINPIILEYSLSDMTDITLNINHDSSYSTQGYKASVSSFEEIYEIDPNLVCDQLYVVTAYEGNVIRITQFYEP